MKQRLEVAGVVTFVVSAALGHYGCTNKMSPADRAEFTVEVARGTCAVMDGKYPDGSPEELAGICRGLLHKDDAGAPECAADAAAEAGAPDAAP